MKSSCEELTIYQENNKLNRQNQSFPAQIKQHSSLRTTKVSQFVEDNFIDIDSQTIQSYAKSKPIYNLKLKPSLRPLTSSFSGPDKHNNSPQSQPIDSEQSMTNFDQLLDSPSQPDVEAVYPQRMQQDVFPAPRWPAATDELEGQLIVPPNSRPSITEKYMMTPLQLDELFSFGRVHFLTAQHSLLKDVLAWLQNDSGFPQVALTPKNLLLVSKQLQCDFSGVFSYLKEFLDRIRPCFAVFYEADLLMANAGNQFVNFLNQLGEQNLLQAAPIYSIFVSSGAIGGNLVKTSQYVGFQDSQDRQRVVQHVFGTQADRYRWLVDKCKFYGVAQFKILAKKVKEEGLREGDVQESQSGSFTVEKENQLKKLATQ